jgi:hypothetical protein
MTSSPHARLVRLGVHLVAAVALIAGAVGCKSRVSVTLCSTASRPIEFVVLFERAAPAQAPGKLLPHGRATVDTRPDGDGDYTLELRSGDRIARHPGRYYTSDGGNDTFTVDENLDVSEGCRVETGSAPAPR